MENNIRSSGYGQSGMRSDYQQSSGQSHIHRPMGDEMSGERDMRSSQGGWGQRSGGWHREPQSIRDVMTSNVKTVTAQASLYDVAQIMKDENVGSVPVVDEERRLLGIITDRDLVVRALAHNRSLSELRAKDVMSSDLEAVTLDEEIGDVLELMGEKQIRRIPVVDREDRLLGLVSIGDIATRADNDEELQNAFQRISSRRSFWNRLWG